MTDTMKRALLDLRARQEAGEHMPCPRCGQDRMKPRLHTNALSRHVDGIFICDECGSAEAMLDFMNNPMPIEDWALFNPITALAHFKDVSGAEAWEQIKAEQLSTLTELFLDWVEGREGRGKTDFKAYSRKVMSRCPGIVFLFEQPFSAVYKVAEGDLILRFKNTDEGVKISKDILRFAK